MWRVIYQIKRKVGTHAECFTILEKALEEHSCSERLWIDIISLELEQ